MTGLKLILSGFAALALLTLVCVFRQGPVTEVDLRERARYALDAQGMTWAEVAARGDSLRLTGVAPTEGMRMKAAEVVQKVRGVRTVSNELMLGKPMAEVFTSLKKGADDEPSTGKKPTRASGEQDRPAQAGTRLDMAKRQLPPEGLRDGNEALRNCQVRTIALMASGKIRFEPAKAEISPESHALLDKLLSIVETCPEARIIISGHTDSKGGDSFNMDLSLRRAEAVADYLAAQGVASSRLSAVGYGEARPVADNDTEAGRARNRRIEIAVTTGRIGGG